jgi:hypothetical protein
MGLYEGIRDVAKLVQQADNIELYRQLIDLSMQAIDMQNEISRLTNENNEFKKQKEIEEQILRFENELYVQLKNDESKIKYCSNCWDTIRKLVQVHFYDDFGTQCPNCKTTWK